MHSKTSFGKKLSNFSIIFTISFILGMTGFNILEPPEPYPQKFENLQREGVQNEG